MTFDKLLDDLKIAYSKPDNEDFRFISYSDESYELIKKFIPEEQIIRMPQIVNYDFGKDKIYIIPVDDNKPIKVCFTED